MTDLNVLADIYERNAVNVAMLAIDLNGLEYRASVASAVNTFKLAEHLRTAARAASIDTLPKGQDAKQGLAGTEGSAVTPKAGDAQ